MLGLFYFFSSHFTISEAYSEPNWMSLVCFSFFVKIVDGLKLLIVFANDLGFDISLGYEFAFKLALNQ